jgi:hypothetical protein
MKGDFSRFTYRPNANYIGVWKQQGRVDLDSDWNEQAGIWSERFRQLNCDILGPFAIPVSPNAFTDDNSRALAISNFTSGPGGVLDFAVTRGLAYVGGYPVIFDKDLSFRAQPDYPEPVFPDEEGDVIAYIEVWEKSVSYVDDDAIREPALGGPDTCLRAKLVAQIRILPAKDASNTADAVACLDRYFSTGNVTLTLQIDESAHQIPLTFGEIDMGGGLIPGNLHYRLEWHRGVDSEGGQSEGLRWSDDNCAVVARILKIISRTILLVDEPEPITGESFKPEDWVEIANRVTELHCQGAQIARIESLDSTDGGLLVKLDSEIHPILARMKNGGQGGAGVSLAPRLRRWSGYISPLALKNVHDLGRGVKAVFHSSGRRNIFEPGDYWTFAIRDRAYNKLYAPLKALPVGIKRYRFPLAIIKRKGKEPTGEIIDCRRFFKPLAI